MSGVQDRPVSVVPGQSAREAAGVAVPSPSGDGSAREETAAEDAPDPARRGGWPGVALRLAVLAGAAGLAWVVATRWNTWVGAAAVQTTEDAYLAADLTPMSARVAGLVREVPIQDFQTVRRGDLLAQIADDDYRAHVHQAEADLAAAEAQLANVQAQHDLQRDNIAAAGATVEAVQAALRRDEAEAERQRNLLETGVAGTRQRVEQAEAALEADRANLDRAHAQVRAAFAQLAVLDAQTKQAEAAREARRAQLDLARINLDYTRITAPADGVVGQRRVRPGQYVGVGTQVVTVVPLPNVWVMANYKETQITHMAPGQPATVRVDAFPGRELRGRVEGFAPASGSQFSLLPADNATGNFTKVVQRIPVKIVLEDVGDLAGRLRPGMSVVPSVRTRER